MKKQTPVTYQHIAYLLGILLGVFIIYSAVSALYAWVYPRSGYILISHQPCAQGETSYWQATTTNTRGSGGTGGVDGPYYGTIPIH